MTSRDTLIIVGASGHGKVIADVALEMKKWERIYFLDDDPSVKQALGIDVVGVVSEADRYKEKADFFVGIGDNRIRARIQDALLEKGYQMASIIHPSAVIGRCVEIGLGTVIMPGVIINSDTKIGKGCIINTRSSLDHDNFIQDYVHISPGVTVAGNVFVGNKAWLGVGSVISNNLSICDATTIGAGSVVLNSITKTGTYIGAPVRRMDK